MSAEKIMVVEDDLTLSAGLCFELDMNGYLTVAAYNIKKARQLAGEDTLTWSYWMSICPMAAGLTCAGS